MIQNHLNSNELTIIQAGHGWIAVNKPSGLSVHNAQADEDDALSLTSRLFENDSALRSACAWSKSSRVSPAHRLDRETSGILLLATDAHSASELQAAFAERAGKKFYRAVVKSAGQNKFTHQKGSWTMPLSDKAEGRDHPAGLAKDRKECETRYHISRTAEHMAELEIELITGRQHQIRRHAALDRHPLLGDTRYGDPKHAVLIQKIFGVSRLMLHAERLELPHRGQVITLAAPTPIEFSILFTEQGARK